MEGDGLPWGQRHRERAWVGLPNHGAEPSARNSSTSLYPRLGHAVLPQEEQEEGGIEGWLVLAGSSRSRRLAHDMLDAGSAQEKAYVDGYHEARCGRRGGSAGTGEEDSD